MVAKIIAPPEPIIIVPDVFGQGKTQKWVSDSRSLQIESANEGKNATQALLRIRLTATSDAVNEILNFPVQLKGRARPFLRIDRRGSNLAVPEFQVHDSAGNQLKVTTQVTESGFDGSAATVVVQLRIERPADGLGSATLTLVGRRPVLVEMPFALKNVPLP